MSVLETEALHIYLLIDTLELTTDLSVNDVTL